MPVRKWGTEQIVNTTTVGNQQDPRVAALPDGGYVITWDDSDPEAGFWAQRFDAFGNKVGAEYFSGASFGRTDVDVTGLDNGGWAITYTYQSTTTPSVFVRRFDSSGNDMGLTAISEDSGDSQASISSLGTGYVVVWRDADINGGDIFARRYDANGVLIGTEIAVNTTTAGSQTDPDVTELANGGFVVSWLDGSDIRARVFDSGGTPLSNDFIVGAGGNADGMRLTALANGGFVVVWHNSSPAWPDESGYHVRAQVFDSTGAAVSVELVVNTTSAGDQAYPDIVPLADGGLRGGVGGLQRWR